MAEPRVLQEDVRKHLLLFLLQKGGAVESYTKLASMVFNLEAHLREHGLSLGYKFDSYALRLNDEELERDIFDLYHQRLIQNDAVPPSEVTDLAETHEIKLKPKGALLLKVFDVEGDLEAALGATGTQLDTVVDTWQRMSRLPPAEVLEEAASRWMTQHPDYVESQTKLRTLLTAPR